MHQVQDVKHRVEIIGDATLILGDCLEALDAVGRVDSIISDPPYEAVTQDKWGVLGLVEYRNFADSGIGFGSIDAMRQPVADKVAEICDGWAVLFCQAEGVRAWRDSFQSTTAKYKRAMVWIKPDAMPQFNGQGPSVGHEMMVALWCGQGHSRWLGGGRPGTFTHCKNSGGAHLHPTQKPLPLMAELVSLFSFPGDLVCDPFCGSGTTGVACLSLGRRFVGIERDPDHFETAIRRIEEAHRQPRLFAEPFLKAEQLGLFEP